MTIEDVVSRIPARWGQYTIIGEGWFSIVSDLNDSIAALDPNYTIAQVKEKFGGLRFYIDDINPDVSSEAQVLIDEAERACAFICEVCGGAGALRTSTVWWRTVCDEHNKQQLGD